MGDGKIQEEVEAKIQEEIEGRFKKRLKEDSRRKIEEDWRKIWKKFADITEVTRPSHQAGQPPPFTSDIEQFKGLASLV